MSLDPQHPHEAQAWPCVPATLALHKSGSPGSKGGKFWDAVRETLSRGNEVEDGRTGHQCHPLVLHTGTWVYTPAHTRALYPAHKHTWICSWPFLL